MAWKLPEGGHWLSGDGVYESLVLLKDMNIPYTKKNLHKGEVIQRKGQPVIGGIFISDGILVEEFENGHHQVCLSGWMLQLAELVMYPDD